jgi:hypothetical protein
VNNAIIVGVTDFLTMVTENIIAPNAVEPVITVIARSVAGIGLYSLIQVPAQE